MTLCSSSHGCLAKPGFCEYPSAAEGRDVQLEWQVVPHEDCAGAGKPAKGVWPILYAACRRAGTMRCDPCSCV